MPQRALEDLIPVTVITGFLGSGKTTVLSYLLGQPAFANTAVVINEFGEISLDHALVRKTSEDIVELQGGCLCCTARGDLLGALQDLFRRRKHGMVPPFARVVVETTGLADPAPILHTLMRDRLIVAVYRLDGVVTTVDCVNGADTFDTHGESVKQAAVADRLLLTKTDLAAPAYRRRPPHAPASTQPRRPHVYRGERPGGSLDAVRHRVIRRRKQECRRRALAAGREFRCAGCRLGP